MFSSIQENPFATPYTNPNPPASFTNIDEQNVNWVSAATAEIHNPCQNSLSQLFQLGKPRTQISLNFLVVVMIPNF
jgi:hypothetical protein